MRISPLTKKIALLVLLAGSTAFAASMMFNNRDREVPTKTQTATSATPSQTMALSIPSGEEAWVDSVYHSLTPRQRVAQLFIPHLTITDTPDGRARIKKFVDNGVGGLLLGKATIGDYARLNDYAQSLAKVPLMITADDEWGVAMRLKDATRFPTNIAIGAGDDLEAVEEYGRRVADQCRALGITVSFAPVADINSNPDNPVIGYRSFGEDPGRVAALVSAYARGMQQGGVLAVAKHFPGHGDTSTDSHHTLPELKYGRERFDTVEFVPFKAAINAGIDGIMVGHLTVPKLDPSNRPASLSKPITTGILKEEMGFDGLVFTDALEMAGAQVPGQNNCVLAFEAGADMLLGSKAPVADIDALLKAVESGRISQQRLDESVRKVLRYKYRLGLTSRQHIDVPNAQRNVNTPAASAADEALGRMAVTVLRDEEGLLPVTGSATVTPVGGKGTVFIDECRRLQGSADTGKPVYIVPVFSAKGDAPARFASLCRQYGGSIIPVFFINPYKLKAFAGALKQCKTVIVVGDDTRGCQLAAAQAIFGKFTPGGRLPVNVPGVASLDEHETAELFTPAADVMQLPAELDSLEVAEQYVDSIEAMTSAITRLAQRGLDAKAYTAIQVLVLKDGETVYELNAGFTDANQNVPVTANTMFDLASVSKVAGTTAALMTAYDDGLFELNDRLDEYLPQLKGDPKGRTTIKEYMFHETGLPAGLNYFRVALDTATYCGRGEPGPGARLRTDLYAASPSTAYPDQVAEGIFAIPTARDSILNAIYAIEPKSHEYKYSDLNFCLLMAAEEQMTGAPHEVWFDEFVARPLGLERTMYWPSRFFDADAFAATEYDGNVRRQRMRGFVHDETAAFSGGVQGNAGLFSNARGLAQWMQMLLNGGVSSNGERLLDAETVDTFLNTRSKSGRRGLGFDVKGPFIGHTGFTGTCFWMDPRRDLAVVVLTNRVYYGRNNAAWRANDPRAAILQVVSQTYK